MAISAWFVNQLQAMKDGGLNLTFDDVLKGLRRGQEWEHPTISEEDALLRIEAAYRRRIAMEKPIESLLTDLDASVAALEKTVARLPR